LGIFFNSIISISIEKKVSESNCRKLYGREKGENENENDKLKNNNHKTI
jgi:hypothetical protein